jgi:RecB family exonuclease
MRVPHIPGITQIQQLSPSVYEALLRCKARAAWAAHGDRSAVPQHPKALLGVCLHSVVEEAHNGRLAGLDGEARLAVAREIFDRRARSLYEQAHPLVRAKFTSPERLPYYNLYRERAALEAIASADRVERLALTAGASHFTPSPRLQAEKKLISSDGLLVGRPDFIDAGAQEVVDYKTGAAPDEAVDGASAAEVRQLRLYVHLALDNGIPVSRAVVARADGQRASIEVSRDDAEAEGRRARELLVQYNRTAGSAFDEAAQPSPENCGFCPCIPFCEAFWRTASPAWAEQCGAHLEGRISSVEESTVQGMKLLTLRVDVQRGTVRAGETFVEQIPESWITADGTDSPLEGDVVRVVHGRLGGDTPTQVIRVDRTATSVWTVAAEG